MTKGKNQQYNVYYCVWYICHLARDIIFWPSTVRHTTRLFAIVVKIQNKVVNNNILNTKRKDGFPYHTYFFYRPIYRNIIYIYIIVRVDGPNSALIIIILSYYYDRSRFFHCAILRSMTSCVMSSTGFEFFIVRPYLFLKC